MNYASFDIGGSAIKYGIVDEKGGIIEKGSFPTPKEDLGELIQGIVDVTRLFQENHRIEGIAISAPGAVNNETGFIGGASALPYIHGPNIREMLEEKTALSVAMENDANCAALAEVWQGVAKEENDVLFVVCGTGIGGAVIKNRTLHTGRHLHGGEFGFMLMETDAKNKKFRTWSDKGSTNALVQHVVKMKGDTADNWNGKKVFQCAEEGDQDCMQAIDEYFETMAMGIFNLQYIYDPDMIVIGGAISAREDMLERVREKLDIMLGCMTAAKIYPNVQKCAFSNDANLIGAVYNYMAMMKQKKK